MREQAGATERAIVDGVGVVTLNRPERFNCISSELITGLDEAITAFENDDSVRVVLVQANGKHFCTGADLDEINQARTSREALASYIDRLHAVLNRLQACPRPVVCAVNGLALAGGLELMMACDVALAARDAQLGDQHAQFGLIPGGGGTQRLARIVGLRRALELMFSARWLSAEEALAWGLVNELTEPSELRDRAMAFCRDLAEKNPEGLAEMKRLTHQGLEMSLRDGLRLEADFVADGLRTANVAEGLAAFQERRPPRFH